MRHHTLFVIDLGSRRVQIAGTTTNPTSAWMEQVARNLTDCVDGFLRGKRYLILDRDALFSRSFKGIVEESGTEIVITSFQAPNMNAYAERFVGSIKAECLDRMIFVGSASLYPAISEYVRHYHRERSHMGLGNELIKGPARQQEGLVERRERLGGLLKYYYRAVA